MITSIKSALVTTVGTAHLNKGVICDLLDSIYRSAEVEDVGLAPREYIGALEASCDYYTPLEHLEEHVSDTLDDQFS